MDKYEILQRFFGHNTFRRGQSEIIDSLSGGRDALCVMPTGAGKSMCYHSDRWVSARLTLTAR